MLVAGQGYMTCPLGLVAENLPDNAGDVRDAASIPRSGRSPGRGHGNSLQYSCLENPMDRNLAGYSPWSHRVGHDLAIKTAAAASVQYIQRFIRCF